MRDGETTGRNRVFAAARASLATAAEQTVSTSVVGECDDKMIIYILAYESKVLTPFEDCSLESLWPLTARERWRK